MTLKLFGVLSVIGLAGCVTPQTTTMPPAGTTFRAYQTVSSKVNDLVNTGYSKEVTPVFDGLLNGKLRALGYEVVTTTPGDLNIEVSIKSAHIGNKALQAIVGFGAGRSLLEFDALFKDRSGRSLGSFSGGKSFHGMELADNALWKGHEEMQMDMIQFSVRQIADFLRNNGKLDNEQGDDPSPQNTTNSLGTPATLNNARSDQGGL